MLTTTAQVRTPAPSRLLRQLCNHWRHKFPVQRDTEVRGRIELPAGMCELEAEGDILRVRLVLSDANACARTEQVVAEHLQRFCQDNELSFDWIRAEKP